MIHHTPAIEAWKDLEEYLWERDPFHGHEVALTDDGIVCTGFIPDGTAELCLVKWRKTDWRHFDWNELPEDLRATLRGLAEPDEHGWIPPEEDFPNLIFLRIEEPSLERGIACMKQALRLLDYGWILAKPEHALCIWQEREWPDDCFSRDVKEEIEEFCSDGQFLFQRIQHHEKLPDPFPWATLTENKTKLWQWGWILACRPDFAPYCPWEKLNAEDWGWIVRKSPGFAPQCPWARLDHENIRDILQEQPQLLPRCEKEKLTAEDWAWILYQQPQLAEFCDLSTFDGNAWAVLLNGQPQFAERCDWNKLKQKDYETLLLDIGTGKFIHPELVKYGISKYFSNKIWSRVLAEFPEMAEKCRNWENMDWDHLLTRQPLFADRCDWRELSGETMFRILQKQPQLAKYCDWTKINGRARCILLYDHPELRQFATKQCIGDGATADCV